ncbi:DUF308 domain-containing protein [Rhodobacteraceae bacterium LMO-12]|nr:DUF308 domain-containing protein [Rhodobacteraceae bacterium LMO-JJ12]
MKPSAILILVGVLLFIGGVFAFANPLAASMAVTTLVGIAFLLGGVLQAWAAFQSDAAMLPGGRIWNGLWAVMGIVVGVWLLANPLEGVVSLTLLLGVVFLFTGIMRIMLGFGIAQAQTKWLLILSGVAGVVIGVLIFGNIAEAATTLLGLLLGIELLSQGVALLLLGFLGRKSGL